MPIEYLWLVLGVAVLIGELFAIRSTLRSRRSLESKGFWILIIVFVPLLGLVLWAIYGPRSALPHSVPTERSRS